MIIRIRDYSITTLTIRLFAPGWKFEEIRIIDYSLRHEVWIHRSLSCWFVDISKTIYISVLYCVHVHFIVGSALEGNKMGTLLIALLFSVLACAATTTDDGPGAPGKKHIHTQTHACAHTHARTHTHSSKMFSCALVEWPCGAADIVHVLLIEYTSYYMHTASDTADRLTINWTLLFGASYIRCSSIILATLNFCWEFLFNNWKIHFTFTFACMCMMEFRGQRY